MKNVEHTVDEKNDEETLYQTQNIDRLLTSMLKKHAHMAEVENFRRKGWSLDDWCKYIGKSFEQWPDETKECFIEAHSSRKTKDRHMRVNYTADEELTKEN